MSELFDTRRRPPRAGAAVLLAAATALSGCVHRLEIPASSGPREEPPPGMAQVDVISDFEEESWNLYAGRNHLCTTPCTQWLDPMRPLSLESPAGERIWLPGLGPEVLEARNGLLVASGGDPCKETNGIVFTSLGGMGVIVGTALTAIGCSDLQRRGGMCTAGLITGGVSLPLTAVAIWMIVDAGPRAEVFPVFRAQPARGQPPVTVGVGPTGVGGTF